MGTALKLRYTVSNIIGRCSGNRSSVYMKVGVGGGAEIFKKSRNQQDDTKQAEY